MGDRLLFECVIQDQEEIMPNTVQFHRVLRTTPERLYRAFIDASPM